MVACARAATLLVLEPRVDRARGLGPVRARRELQRLALALAAHDPQRTLARGYALVEDRAGQPVTSAPAAAGRGEIRVRFHDDAVDAEAR